MFEGKLVNIAIIGATGLVGSTIARVLEERSFPVGEIIPVATELSSGADFEIFGKRIRVLSLREMNFELADICFFTAGEEISKEYIPKALEAKCLVVDNTAAYRYTDEVPLVVPEINGSLITERTRLVASPNCTTIILVMALAAIHRVSKLRRVVVASFQSVSGSGREALKELKDQTEAQLSGGKIAVNVYEKRIAFNCIPKIGNISSDGSCFEEEKIVKESRKILSHPGLQVVPTTVRVPVMVGHALSVNLELENDLSIEEAKDALRHSPGVEIADDFPTPMDVAGKDNIMVGRIRRDQTRPHAICLWIVGDNLRKGAASNSVQIAELMLDALK